MIRIYKDGQVREVNNIDASAWIKSGWSLKAPKVKEDTVSGETIQDTFMETPPPSENQMRSRDDTSSSSTDSIDINQASADEIAEKLTGVGTKTAAALIENRPYTAIADLEKALPKIDWESLKGSITF